MLDTDDIGSNNSSNAHIEDLIATRISRRNLLTGAAALAAAGLVPGALLSSAPAAANSSRVRKLRFEAVPTSTADTFVVPKGYRTQVIAPWGTPLIAGAPAFAEDASNTAADQALQVGFNHDGLHYFPLKPFGNTRGLLVMNHEYTDASQIYTAAQGSTITNDAAGREKVAKALAGHGVSVIAIHRNRSGSW